MSGKKIVLLTVLVLFCASLAFAAAPDVNIATPTTGHYRDNITVDFNTADADGGDLRGYIYWTYDDKNTFIIRDDNIFDGGRIDCDDNDFTDSTNCTFAFNTEDVNLSVINMDNNADWSLPGTGDTNSITVSTTQLAQGEYSIYVDVNKDVDADTNAGYAWYTFEDVQDWNQIMEADPTTEIGFWVYITDVDNLKSGTAIQVNLTDESADSNIMKYYFNKTTISNGWNFLTADLNSGTAGGTGLGDWTTIKKILFHVFYVDDTVEMPYYLDELKIISYTATDGNYLMNVDINDGGTTTSALTNSFVVDNTDPVTANLTPASNLSNEGDLDYNFTLDVNDTYLSGCVATVYLNDVNQGDNSATVTGTAPDHTGTHLIEMTETAQTNNTYYVAWTCTDIAGNSATRNSNTYTITARDVTNASQTLLQMIVAVIIIAVIVGLLFAIGKFIGMPNEIVLIIALVVAVILISILLNSGLI